MLSRIDLAHAKWTIAHEGTRSSRGKDAVTPDREEGNLHDSVSFCSSRADTLNVSYSLHAGSD
eukprot:1465411-Pleurochrysis_carterae.AAC.1